MRYTLKFRDWMKGLIMAIGAPVLTFIIDSLNEGELTLNWRKLAIVALSAGLMYLLKNFFTDDVKSAVKVLHEAEKKGLDVPYSAPGDSSVK